MGLFEQIRRALTSPHDETTSRDDASFGDFVYTLHDPETKSLRSEDGNLVVKAAVTSKFRVFTRVGKRFGVGDLAERGTERWLVGELDGVRAYYDGHSVILTREDLYP